MASRRGRGRSLAEWTTLAASLIVVTGVLGAVTWLHLTGSEEPASIVVEPRLDAVRHEAGRYELPVVIRNTGGRTGENVRIGITLEMPDGTRDTAAVDLRFLAAGARRHASVAFARDPRAGRIAVAWTGQVRP